MAKLYYSIKEVCDIIDEEQYILRYWEKEFSILHPKKNKAGNRTYSPKDLLICKYLKHLIREERLHIKDVKAILKSKSIAEILSKYEVNENENENLNESINDTENNSENENLEDIKTESVNTEQIDNNVEDIKPIEVESFNNDTNYDTINEVEHYSDAEILNELTNDISNENNEFENLAYLEFTSKIEDSLEEDIITDEIIDEFSNETIENEEEIEKLLDLSIDKKIVLKNHLFEDFEEFSVLPAELFYDKLKEQKTYKTKNDEPETESEIEVSKQDGVFISYENLHTLIDILKEIRKLIV